jgi:glycerol-3-phosphate dehydrogenase
MVTTRRELMLQTLVSFKDPWDIVVIGGGATGLGIAVDASSRGYKTLLVEQYDFGKGTSSKSTKLVHGGVRYLAKGDIALVYEGLKERGLMKQNAPHLVKNQKFIIPVYTRWDVFLYTIGLKFYDLLSGKLGLGRSYFMSKEETIKALPTLNKKGLKGGILYHDGQFDDTRMLVNLARTCEDHGGTVINYMKVTGLIKENDKYTGDDRNKVDAMPDRNNKRGGNDSPGGNERLGGKERFTGKGRLVGLKITDQETFTEYIIRAKSIINATGIFADEIIQLDEPGTKRMIRPSQGIHIVLDRDFLKSDHAMMIPRTSDGRVMFAVPWYNRIVIGTTDTIVDRVSPEPRALEDEIKFLLETTGQYLDKKPTKQDILSIFAGLRPLAAPQVEGKSTKDISRRHKINVSVSGLITIVGGKWTSYRRMAEDAVNEAINSGHVPWSKCITADLKIHGYDDQIKAGSNPYSTYGSDQPKLTTIENESQEFAGFLSESLQIKKSQIILAVREELARTVEDVLARRIRALFLDTRESIKIAPETARLMAKELGYGDDWINSQLRQFSELAAGYLGTLNTESSV